jgi:tetratricopeptide (TPR) repeat protein
MNNMRKGALVLALVPLAASTALGEDAWVGRRCMPKEGCVIKIGNRETPAKAVPLPYRVQQVSGEWLWIGEGWVQKSRVVPFEEAIEYYTQYLRTHSNSAWAYNLRGWTHFDQGDYDDAVKDYSATIRLDPRDPIAFNNRGGCYQRQGDYANALKDYNEAVRLSPTESWGYNSVAWLLATCPEERYRDGKLAVTMATKACTIAGWKDPYLIDTLAAAYAESGDFESAIRWQTKATEMLAHDEQAVKAGRERLEMYRESKPYREEPAK